MPLPTSKTLRRKRRRPISLRPYTSISLFCALLLTFITSHTLLHLYRDHQRAAANKQLTVTSIRIIYSELFLISLVLLDSLAVPFLEFSYFYVDRHSFSVNLPKHFLFLIFLYRIFSVFKDSAYALSLKTVYLCLASQIASVFFWIGVILYGLCTDDNWILYRIPIPFPFPLTQKSAESDESDDFFVYCAMRSNDSRN